MSRCDTIALHDAVAESICEKLRHAQVPIGQVDDPRDLYAMAIDFAVDEFRENFDRFRAQPMGHLESPWADFLTQQGVALPFIFLRTEDLTDAARQRIHLLVQHLPTFTNAQEISRFLHNEWHLAFDYAADHTGHPSHALGLATLACDRELCTASCLDMMSLMQGIALLLELPLHVYDQFQKDAKPFAHVVGLDATGIIDPTGEMHQYTPRTLRPLTDLLALSGYALYNESILNQCALDAHPMHCRIARLEMADRLVPGNPRILNALAYYVSQE